MDAKVTLSFDASVISSAKRFAESQNTALEHGCKCIVIEDKNDFYFSEIGVFGSEAFLKQFVF